MAKGKTTDSRLAKQHIHVSLYNDKKQRMRHKIGKETQGRRELRSSIYVCSSDTFTEQDTQPRTNTPRGTSLVCLSQIFKICTAKKNRNPWQQSSGCKTSQEVKNFTATTNDHALKLTEISNNKIIPYKTLMTSLVFDDYDSYKKNTNIFIFNGRSSK